MPLSNKQMEYLAIAWSCFIDEPKIDYEKFHKIAGLSSAHSARELMRVTKNKLKAEYGSKTEGIDGLNTPKIAKVTKNAKTSASKRSEKTDKTQKRGNKRAANDGDDTPITKSQAKKSRRQPTEDDEDPAISSPVIKPDPGLRSAADSETPESDLPPQLAASLADDTLASFGAQGDYDMAGDFY